MRSTWMLIAAVLAAACAPGPRPLITPDDGQLGPGATVPVITQAPNRPAPTDDQQTPDATPGAGGSDSAGSGDDSSEEPGDGGTIDGGEGEAPPVTPRP